MVFIPSEEQATIFDAVLKTQDNIAIKALAGTGKTTTLVELAKRLPAGGSKVFCAFNRDIVSELKDRLNGTGMWASTFHSLGRTALIKKLGVKGFTPNATKYREMVDVWAQGSLDYQMAVAAAIEHIEDPNERGDTQREYHREGLKAFVDLLNFGRLKLVDWQDTISLRLLIEQYRLGEDFDDNEDMLSVIIDEYPRLMAQAEAETQRLNIDFTDMIYWPVAWNAAFQKYQWVFVDECQDLNPVQREMISRIVAGRIVLVGDPHQAIYEFAGADSDSFDLSVEAFRTRVLPLTVTRRCDAVVTQHAAARVPAFRCLPDKARGKIVWIDESRTDVLKSGDIVLCRVKAPLVAMVLELIAANRPAIIRGNEIGKGLIKILEKLLKRKDYVFENLLDLLTDYENGQVERYMKKDDQPMIEAVHDQCEALRVIIESAKAPSYELLVERIESLFSDNLENCIVLSTVHKAKGLEADRVFILKPEKLPLTWPGQRKESFEQEKNLDYVARTRAKHVLAYFTNAKYTESTGMPSYAQKDFEDKEWTVQPFLPLGEAEPETAKVASAWLVKLMDHHEPDGMHDTHSVEQAHGVSMGEEWWKPTNGFRATGDLRRDLAIYRPVDVLPAPRQRLQNLIAGLSRTEAENLIEILRAHIEAMEVA